ncbi:MAG: hypothetical protein R3178_00270 [Rhodothermales bacterium]|nr:hypothetical protein [Rhodothermales bacterium]
MMKAQQLPALVIAATVFGLSACQEPSISRSDDGLLFLGSHEASDVVERVIAPGNRSLILDGFAGTVQLTGTDSDVARFQITRTARGDSPDEAQSQLQNLEIEEVGDETSYRYKFAAADGALSRFDVVGTVPAGTDLRIRWVAGDLELGGLSGDLDVQSQHGSLSYTGSGSIVHMRTRNGSVHATLSAVSEGSDVDLLTANGDVVAALPAGASTHLEASTSAGSIATGTITFVSESFSSMDAGAKFEGRLGEGAGRVAMRTQHGSIDISTFVPQIKDLIAEPDSLRPETPDVPVDTIIADQDSVIAAGVTADSLR